MATRKEHIGLTLIESRFGVTIDIPSLVTVFTAKYIIYRN